MYAKQLDTLTHSCANVSACVVEFSTKDAYATFTPSLYLSVHTRPLFSFTDQTWDLE